MGSPKVHAGYQANFKCMEKVCTQKVIRTMKPYTAYTVAGW